MARTTPEGACNQASWHDFNLEATRPRDGRQDLLPDPGTLIALVPSGLGWAPADCQPKRISKRTSLLVRSLYSLGV
jgi:hypothetical protein